MGRRRRTGAATARERHGRDAGVVGARVEHVDRRDRAAAGHGRRGGRLERVAGRDRRRIEVQVVAGRVHRRIHAHAQIPVQLLRRTVDRRQRALVGALARVGLRHLRQQRDDVLVRVVRTNLAAIRVRRRARDRVAGRIDDLDVERAVLPEQVVDDVRQAHEDATAILQRCGRIRRVTVAVAGRAIHVPGQLRHDVRRVLHRHEAGRLRDVRPIRLQAVRVLRLIRIRRRQAPRRRRGRVDRAQRLEEHARGRGRVVRGHGVVHELRLERVLQRHATAVPAGDIVHDDVVGHRDVVPVVRRLLERHHFRAVGLAHAQAAARAVLGAVAEDQVRVDHEARTRAVANARRAVEVGGATALHAAGERAIFLRAHDDDAAAVDGQRRVVGLVEQHEVVVDLAVEADAHVRDAATVARGQVGRDPVVVDLVEVRPRADRDAACTRRRTGEQRIANRGVVDDLVVVDADVRVQLHRNHAVRLHIDARRDRRAQRRRVGRAAIVAEADRVIDRERRRRLAIAEVDRARQRTGVRRDARVGDLHVVRPAVQEDAATTLRAVDDADAVNAGRVAQVVAGRVVRVARARGLRIAVRRGVHVAAAVRERACATDLTPEVSRAGESLVDAAADDRDARALVGAHQRGLLQDLRQVAVAGRIPADEALERDTVCTEVHACRAGVRAGRIEARRVRQRRAVDRQAEQAAHPATPGVHLAGRLRVRVDRDGTRAHALQAHRLPHDHVLAVRARIDDQQVARRGIVDRRLQRVVVDLAPGLAARARGRDDRRGLAAHGDRDAVDRLLAVAGGHDDFAADRRRGDAVLLHRAQGQARRHGDVDRPVIPAVHGRGQAADRHARDRGASAADARALGAEAVMARRGLVVVRRHGRRGARELRVLDDTIAVRLQDQGHGGGHAADRGRGRRPGPAGERDGRARAVAGTTVRDGHGGDAERGRRRGVARREADGRRGRVARAAAGDRHRGEVDRRGRRRSRRAGAAVGERHRRRGRVSATGVADRDAGHGVVGAVRGRRGTRRARGAATGEGHPRSLGVAGATAGHLDGRDADAGGRVRAAATAARQGDVRSRGVARAARERHVRDLHRRRGRRTGAGAAREADGGRRGVAAAAVVDGHAHDAFGARGPGADVALEVGALDDRRRIRVLGIRQVVVVRERLGRRHRRIHVGREARHERRLVAEVAVRRVVRRVRDHLAVGRRLRIQVLDRARIVHAGDRHLRRVARRVRRVHFPAREVHAVVGTPLVRIDAGHFVADEVAHADRQVRDAELLTELRRERIELRGHVVRHATDEVRRDVVLREHEELRADRILVVQRDFLAIAQRPRGARERGRLADRREQAHDVRHHAGLADARPDLVGAGEVLARVDDAEVGRRVHRVVRVVVAIQRRLVGQDKDVAEAGDLLRDRRDIDVAHEDVLVLFLDDLVARRRHDLDHVIARRQDRVRIEELAGDRILVDRVRDADRAVRARELRRVDAVQRTRAGRATRRRITVDDARELVLAVVRRRRDLVQHRPAVEALELRLGRQRVLVADDGAAGVIRRHRGAGRRIVVQPHLAALEGREEAAGRILARTVHVRDGAAVGRHCQRAGARAVRAEALGPLVPAGGVGRVDERQRLHAIGCDVFLVQVDLHVRYRRLPHQLREQRRVVIGTRRGIHDEALDAAGLARLERLHAEVDEAVLAEQALPALGAPRRVDTAAGQAGRRSRAATARVCRNRAEHVRAVEERIGRLAAVGIRAIDGARDAQLDGQRIGLDGAGEVGGGDRAGEARVVGLPLHGAVVRATGVVDDVLAGLLEAGRVGLDDQPVHEREHLVVRGVAIQVGLILEADAAVTVADGDRQQRDAAFEVVARGVTVRDAVVVGVQVRARVDVRAPLGRRHGHRRHAVDRDRVHQAVEHDVVPLVEHRQLVGAVRQVVEREVAVRVALREREGLLVRHAQRRVAVREPERVVGFGVVGALVRRAAHVVAVHGTLNAGVADQATALRRGVTQAGAGAVAAAIVDDLRVGEADLHVEAARTELLEVRRLARTDERLVRLAAVERVGLQPFLAARDAVGRRERLRLVDAGVEVVDDRLARERRHGRAVGLVVRARDDHADDVVRVRADRAGNQARHRVLGARQRVGQRHVEHVVGDLPGAVTERTGLVQQLDLEAAEAGLVRRDDVDAAAGIVLAVQRVVVLVHEHRDLRDRQRRLGERDRDRGGDRIVLRIELRADLDAAHVVAALAGAGREVAQRRAIDGRVELAHLAGDRVGHGAARALHARVDAVTRHHGEEVVLVRIEVDIARQQLIALRRVGATCATADVADRGHAGQRLAVLAGDRAHAAGRDHRHAGRVEVVAERLDGHRRAVAAVGVLRSRGAAGVDLALRVDPERAVFLDDPAIVVGQRPAVLLVDERDREARTRREVQRDGGGCGRGCTLRVLDVVGERVVTRSRDLRGERAVRIDLEREARGRYGARIHGQRQAGGIGVVQQHAGRVDDQQLLVAAGVAVVREDRRSAEGAAERRAVGGVALLDRRRDGRRDVVHGVRERAAAGRRRRGRRVAERAVRLQRERARQRRVAERHAVGTGRAAEQAAQRVGHVQRRAVDAVVGLGRTEGQRRARTATGGADAGRRAAGDSEVRLHAAIVLVVGRQAQLAVEDRVGRGRVDAGRLRGLDDDVIGLAGGEEHLVLQARHARQRVAVLGDQRHRQADDRGHVHAQAGVDEPNGDVAGHGGRRHRQDLGRRRANVGAVERRAVDEVVARAVVDGRRIAGVVRRRRRVAAATGLAAPHGRLGEARRADRGVDRLVLGRIDFAEHDLQVGVVDGGRGGRQLRIGRERLRRRRAGRGGDNQDAVQAHRRLDRRVRARLDQVGAGTQVVPGERRRGADDDFGTERLHARQLRRRRRGRAARGLEAREVQRGRRLRAARGRRGDRDRRRARVATAGAGQRDAADRAAAEGRDRGRTRAAATGDRHRRRRRIAAARGTDRDRAGAGVDDSRHRPGHADRCVHRADRGRVVVARSRQLEAAAQLADDDQ